MEHVADYPLAVMETGDDEVLLAYQSSFLFSEYLKIEIYLRSNGIRILKNEWNTLLWFLRRKETSLDYGIFVNSRGEKERKMIIEWELTPMEFGWFFWNFFKSEIINRLNKSLIEEMLYFFFIFSLHSSLFIRYSLWLVGDYASIREWWTRFKVGDLIEFGLVRREKEILI